MFTTLKKLVIWLALLLWPLGLYPVVGAQHPGWIIGLALVNGMFLGILAANRTSGPRSPG